MKDSFSVRDSIEVNGKRHTIASLAKFGNTFDIKRLPYSMKILLENLLRQEDGVNVTAKEIEAVAKWDALDLEAAIDEARVCGGMVRSNDEWLAHPHGQVLARKPIVEITKIGDSDPEPLPRGDRPLSGIRALDLTRILAGASPHIARIAITRPGENPTRLGAPLTQPPPLKSGVWQLHPMQPAGGNRYDVLTGPVFVV